MLRLPPPAIADILKDLPPQAVKKLTPWDLQHAHYDYLKEKAAKKRNAKPRKQYREPTEEDLPTELTSLVLKALSALNLIAEYKISNKETNRTERYRHQIEMAWNRAAYNLKDPEHKKKPWWETHPAEEFAES